MKLVKTDRLRQLLSRSYIRVYSYQGEKSYQNYLKNGYLSGDTQHLQEECEWLEAYDWMKSQMAKRIPDYTGDYPVWAWAKRPSAKPKYQKTMSDSKYRFTALVPTGRVLASDYDLWHSPLNGFAVTMTEKEFDTFNGDPKSTWERIFDFTSYNDKEKIDWLGICHKRQVQLCIDRVYAAEIVEIRQI